MSGSLAETAGPTPELSPMKRALAEIRRLRAELDSARRRMHEPIAVLGCALRLPGGVDTPERFWEALAQGEDLITTIPPERWEASLFWSADPNQAGTMHDLHGGFLQDVDAFDAEFFGINPREAESMDPQHRLLLEVTWEALERSGLDPRSLRDTSAGVFLGMSNSDYSRLLTQPLRSIDGYTGIGSAMSLAAGRIAYMLGTHGPAVVTETACSSSLVALHQAVGSLRAGETDLAIVGGINLMLSPEMHLAFARSGMLSPTGRCRTFDAAADGYVRSEGCGVVILKRLADARRDGHFVLATVQGTAVNQDGRSAGITAPNGPAQEAVLRAALADAGVEPSAVGFVETHGTGTPLGDPIELRALGAVYGGGARSPDAPLYVGAVKANLGHTEAAAGITGLLKVVQMLQAGHGIPPHLHLKTASPHVDWERWGLRIPGSLIPWNSAQEPAFAAVSSFGFSGTNAHAIVGPGDPVLVGERDESPVARPLCLSAPDEDCMRALAERYVAFLGETSLSLGEMGAAALATRTRFPFRLVVQASTSTEAAAALARWLAGEITPQVATGTVSPAADEAFPGSPHTSLGVEAEAFLLGKALEMPLGTKRPRHVQLPTYPFRRRRFWLGGSALERRSHHRRTVYAEVCRRAAWQSTQAPLGWSMTGFAGKRTALVQLTRAYARNTLVQAGLFQEGGGVLSAADVVEVGGFLPLYVHLLQRWMEDLAEVGLLTREEDRFRTHTPLTMVDLGPVWTDATRALYDDPGPLAYLRNCGALLFEVLTGRASALETLFPDGSFALAEGIYERSAEAVYVNAIVAEAVRTAAGGLGRGRTIRILEIGSGTGGTTASVLPALPSTEVEYWFTDLSELFLERARRRFRDFNFVHFASLDLGRGLQEQGLRPGMFDLVLAANVVHAAPSLPTALGHIRELLVTGGTLVLLETTQHQPWFDMSVGLIEGWQHFDDPERQKHPLLDPEAWCDLLARSGFRESQVVPGRDAPSSAIAQRVILAQSTAEPLVQPDAATDGVALEKVAVSKAGGPASEAFSGGSFAVLSVELQDLSPEARDEEIAAIARRTIHEVFRLEGDPEALSDRDRLSDLGMDSLIALELRAELARRLGMEGRISSTVAFETGTVGELIRRLCELASPTTSQASPLEVPALRSALPLHTAEELADMSEEDVEMLLAERLNRV